MGLSIEKATRQQIKLRMAFTGPSGSGKTYSALVVASGLGQKIIVIDTERSSASLYAGLPDIPAFDTIKINEPYTIDKYLEGLKMAIDSGYEVIIIDSISHAWAGEGGLLEKKGALDVRGGNSYTNWAPITKEHEKFKSALLNCPVHLMVTMRSKQDYILEVNDKGKSAPRKVGMAPIQRDGLEYEFDMVLDVAMDHNASISKTRVKAFDGRIFKPTEETGKELLAWLNEGAVPKSAPVALAIHTEPAHAPTTPPANASLTPKAASTFNADGKRLITEPQRKRLWAICKQVNKSEADLKQFLFDSLGIDSTKDIPMDDYEQVCAWVEA